MQTYSKPNNNKNNRLQKVSDLGGDMPGMADYAARTGDDYDYDDNGNMIYDPAKEGAVKHNYLNLPERVDLGTQGKIYYHYDAAGNKLAKYIENSNRSENTTTNLLFKSCVHSRQVHS